MFNRKSKVLPKELQKIVLDYADLTEKYPEFYDENRQSLNMVNNAQKVCFRPAQFIIGQTYARCSTKTPGTNLLLGAVGFTTAGLSVFVTAPFAGMAALGTGIKDLSMFAHRKVKERSLEEVFDADLLKKALKP